jgi:hypothetical protein
MKETPILFSAEMIRAILDGRKTQTRRVVIDKYLPGPEATHCELGGFIPSPCPYGQIGDRLWVKETFLLVGGGSGDIFDEQNARVVYRATNDGPDAWVSPVWRPSIFMPRWASRILLEVTNVRVERVQSISEADVRAEGIQVVGYGDYPDQFSGKHLYQDLWDKLNGEREGGIYAWAKNPFCWCVTFRRLDDSAGR